MLVVPAFKLPTPCAAGAKDLEMFAGAAGAGEPLFVVEVTTIQGKKRLLSGSALRCAARHCLARHCLAGHMGVRHRFHRASPGCGSQVAHAKQAVQLASAPPAGRRQPTAAPAACGRRCCRGRACTTQVSAAPRACLVAAFRGCSECLHAEQ